MIGKIKILKPGILSSIQDKGRFGFSKFGVPRSGAMDQKSYALANFLLGNDQDDACIEWVFQSPVLEFSEPTIISLTGAEANFYLNDKKIKMNRRIRVDKKDVLSSGFCKKNMYGYVGIKNGLITQEALSSKSYYKSITDQYVLHKNDEITYHKIAVFENHFSNISVPNFIENKGKLKVYKGAEFDQLSETQKQVLLNTNFTISNTINRMAIQLEEKLDNDLPSILTSAVLPGTIQLTPSGKLIVLMRDCQTTGGYPRVLQLTEDAINNIAQKRMKDKCSFELL
ncbi:5-oxoprolinase subunit C family protein [Aquimarina sediminis]|uniref:5-oxoprolinase subunit C family protein n=1 Tax=Aquimarina sediminis TaxID=2070536 RepID=UPI000CA03910|nr:biotin-dependent carboxyltransferase family protein [Aquimarina sediminis]